MNLKKIMLIGFVLLTQITLFAQKIALDFSNVSLEEVINAVEAKTDFKFLYNKQLVDVSRKVSVSVQDKEINAVLNDILKGTGISYTIIGKQIVLSKTEEKEKSQILSGTVTDNNGEFLVGVSVIEKGTTRGVVTDVDGSFKINVKQGTMLKFSSVGYQTIEQEAVPNMTITLPDDAQNIDDVVVVGYGVQKKINLTGAVTTIGSEAIDSRPVTDVARALQGAIAGVNFSNDNGGELGEKMSLNIRGAGSIGQGSNSDPLVLIDGVEGDMNSLNPSDIESFTVLKDASAASIYGSRAAFGVVLITTKSGSVGRVKVSFNSNIRLSNPISVPKMVSSVEYANALNDAARVTDGTTRFSQSNIDKMISNLDNHLPGIEPSINDNSIWQVNAQQYANINYYDLHLKTITPSYDNTLSVSGGIDKKVTYYFSAGYLSQNGIFKFADENLNRLSLNGKVDAWFHKKIKFSYNTRFIRENYDKPVAQTAQFYHALSRSAPNVAIYYPSGTYSNLSWVRQLQEGGRFVQQKDFLYNQGKLEIEPLKNWKIYAELNSRIETPQESKQIKKFYDETPLGTLVPAEVIGSSTSWRVEPNGTFNANVTTINGKSNNYYEIAKSKNLYLSSNLYTNYELNLANAHHFLFLVGMQTEYYSASLIRSAADNILSDDTPFLPNLSNTTDNRILIAERKGEWSNLGIFGRINYDYKERYLLEINLRVDGASRFPPNKRWGIFPAFSLGWNIAKEDFWEPFAKTANLLKIRASYGLLGNQNTTSFYPYFQSMTNSSGQYLINNTIVTTLSSPLPVSENITWEKVENYSIGIDWGLFQNKLTGSVDYYQRRTYDMIGPANLLPAVYGVDFVNYPKINNTEMVTNGWEVEVTWKDVIGKEFNYSVSAVVSDYLSKITKYNNPEKILFIDGKPQFYDGKILGEIWGFETLGIAQTDKQMNEHIARYDQSALGSNWAAGDIMYANLDDNPKITQSGATADNPQDLKVIGNSTPRYAFGIRLGMSWRWLDFSAFIQGIGKRDLYGYGNVFFGVEAPYRSTFWKEHLDYWRPNGDPNGSNTDAYYARPRFGGIGANPNQYTQTRFLQNAAYVRLKNLQLGYTLPSDISQKVWINKLRIYLSVDNLLTFTKLRIVDPEAVAIDTNFEGSGKVSPMSRTFSFGLNLTF